LVNDVHGVGTTCRERCGGVMQEKIHSRLDLTSRWANEPTAAVAGHGDDSDEGLRRTGKSVSITFYLLTYYFTDLLAL